MSDIEYFVFNLQKRMNIVMTISVIIMCVGLGMLVIRLILPEQIQLILTGFRFLAVTFGLMIFGAGGFISWSIINHKVEELEEKL